MFSNKFEMLKSRVMNISEGDEREISKDRKMILREEKLKKEKSVEVQKTEVENSDNKIKSRNC